jgi:two-component system response regulator MprA
VDLEAREVRRGSASVNLTRTEFAILECLMKSAGRVVTRDRLIDFVWGDREINSNNLEVFIRFLRAKIDPPDSRKLIQTERGIGYSLRESG